MSACASSVRRRLGAGVGGSPTSRRRTGNEFFGRICGVEAPVLELIGRETDMARLRRVVEAVDEGSRGLLLRGAPGIGKTALWSWGLRTAREAGGQVLATRCAEVE